MQGSGFSLRIRRPAGLRDDGVYPTPSEAVNSSRTNPRLQRAVRGIGMGVDIAAPEAALAGKRCDVGPFKTPQTESCMPSSTTRSGGMRKNSIALAD